MSNQRAREPFDILRQHRPLLLACETIGWLHMTGKAHEDFLEEKGGRPQGYKYEYWPSKFDPPVPWQKLLEWLTQRFPLNPDAWPVRLADFLEKHAKRNPGLLGLLQAGHAMASGIEKNLPRRTSWYLAQDATQMWLSSPFGQPLRNLLGDRRPEVLSAEGRKKLSQGITGILKELRSLGSGGAADQEEWRKWREAAIGPNSYLRAAFTSTVAETRLPNNDVTLWDQSYVAAALFKSAVAAALLASGAFPWSDPNLKGKMLWRVLIIGLGARHYEARAVKIGDCLGARADIERFFDRARSLIEVDLALGAMVFRDSETMAFTFPGLLDDPNLSGDDSGLSGSEAGLLRASIEHELKRMAKDLKLETSVCCQLSPTTRSFVKMVSHLRNAREQLAVPIFPPPPDIHADPHEQTSHVCPVCQVRFNVSRPRDGTHNIRKQRVCSVCERRRQERVPEWLDRAGETIWISELADQNDRVALLTLSLDLEPWLQGERTDSLRAQAIGHWRDSNTQIRIPGQRKNPWDPNQPFASLLGYLQRHLNRIAPHYSIHKSKLDPVLRSLQDGYEHHCSMESFFWGVVEDRAPHEMPDWSRLNHRERAAWLTHQLFRKLSSPGRIYRFQRTAEGFFDGLLQCFEKLVTEDRNPWRVKRLFLRPLQGPGQPPWTDRHTYAGRWKESPIELLYLADKGRFVTIANLARSLGRSESKEALVPVEEESLKLWADDGQTSDLQVEAVEEAAELSDYAPLIVLDRTPLRFRVLVPLDRGTACVQQAIAMWREQFGRVWDRLPLRVGVVAFPRKTPFQAVIEAARFLEARMAAAREERWRVVDTAGCAQCAVTILEGPKGNRETVATPITLPDGREDVFYPYVRVEDSKLRHPLDFRHPKGRIFRHVRDLEPGDEIVVNPSLFASVFLDTTARRFEPLDPRPLGDFERMTRAWKLLRRVSPSITALRALGFELGRMRSSWRDPDNEPLPGADDQRTRLGRALLQSFPGITPAELDALGEALQSGILEWSIDWHLIWLKERLQEDSA
jgi:hypothetical protein